LKKHTNGSGTTYKRVVNGKTYYSFKVSLADGTRKAFTAKTAREAREKADAYLESIQAGAVNVGEGAKLTINAYLDQYLEERVLPYCKPNTYTGYVNKFDLYTRPTLGAVKISELREIDLERWLSGLGGKLGGYSIHQTFAAFKTALNVAVKHYKLISYNPAIGIDLRKILGPQSSQKKTNQSL